MTNRIPVTICTQHPIAAWLKDTFQEPKSDISQIQTAAKWHAYLQQHSTLTNSPLSVEPHSILGLLTHVTSEGKPLTEVAKPPQLPFFTVTNP